MPHNTKTHSVDQEQQNQAVQNDSDRNQLNKEERQEKQLNGARDRDRGKTELGRSAHREY
jgi:hypothetical protein